MRERWMALVLLGCVMLAALSGCATVQAETGGGANRPAATGTRY